MVVLSPVDWDSNVSAASPVKWRVVVFSPAKAPSPGSSAVSEKVRTRLEELDDQEEVQEPTSGFSLEGSPPASSESCSCLKGCCGVCVCVCPDVCVS